MKSSYFVDFPMHKDVLNLSIVVNIQVFIAVSKNCSYFFNNFSSN